MVRRWVRIIAAQGIPLYLGVLPESIVVDDGMLTGVSLADGRHLDADLVVFAVGVRPRDDLAASGGLREGCFGGFRVDQTCRTSVDNIWAIGEVAAVDGARCVGLVAPANTMAEVVADRLLGGSADFPGVDLATKLKLSGVDVASFGDAQGKTDGCLEVVYADPARGLYQKLVLSDDGVTLLGGILVGDAEAYSSLRPMVGRPLPAEPGAYLSAGSGGEPVGGELPDDAVRLFLQQRHRRYRPAGGSRRGAGGRMRRLHRYRDPEVLQQGRDRVRFLRRPGQEVARHRADGRWHRGLQGTL